MAVGRGEIRVSVGRTGIFPPPEPNEKQAERKFEVRDPVWPDSEDPSLMQRLGFDWLLVNENSESHHRYHQWLHVTFPLWLIALITASLPCHRIASAVRAARRKGRCICCGYSLTGNASGTCPECGMPISRKTEVEA
jgi:hypothetical protein